jgi:pimeloyl-ACP methyl ester carboxylesterase
MQCTAADGVDLAYRVLGKGTLPVLLVHGWMVSGEIWDDLAAALDVRDLRLVIPDLRGAGAAGRPDSGDDLARHVAELWTVLEHAHAKKPIVIGRLSYLPGPGHYPQIERPRETTAIVEAFLAAAG